MTILLVCGSFRKNSFNMTLARDAQKALEALGVESEILSYEDVPLFNQDLEIPPLSPVSKAREAFGECEAFWFFTPEYNGQIPGVLKNLIDWMSRPMGPDYGRFDTPVYGKKACITGAGGANKTAGARELLAKVLKFIGVKVFDEQLGIKIAPADFKSDSISDPQEIEDQIDAQAKAFVDWLKQ